MKFANEVRSDSSHRSARSVTSECWVYTHDGGVREVTLPTAQQTLIVDGQLLRAWYLLDSTTLGCAVATLYSVEAPSRDLRETVLHLARERFQNRSWYRELAREA